jgi:hypothetical protein
MEQFLNKLPWGIIIILCMTLGLAPYKPPHIVEKVTMLMQGKLVRPIDWFDLLLHGTPWVLLILKLMFGRKA